MSLTPILHDAKKYPLMLDSAVCPALHWSPDVQMYVWKILRHTIACVCGPSRASLMAQG